MKVKDLQGQGLTGKMIVLNLMDCYEASHASERINALLSGRDSYEQGCATLNDEGIQEALCLLEMAGALLSKIAVKPSEMPSIFLPSEEEMKEGEC